MPRHSAFGADIRNTVVAETRSATSLFQPATVDVIIEWAQDAPTAMRFADGGEVGRA